MSEAAYFPESWPLIFDILTFYYIYLGPGSKSGSGSGLGTGTVKTKSYGSCGSGSGSTTLVEGTYFRIFLICLISGMASSLTY
jgi:hypothetical protein